MKQVVDFIIGKDSLYHFDFTIKNKELTTVDLSDTDFFSHWVNRKLQQSNCRYGIGGYNEHRTIYSRSAHFDTEEEPRRLHLGVDIWGAVGTPVYNFNDAVVHSYHFNNNFGDYGATIILKYELNGLHFHVLYGHLSLSALDGLKAGMPIAAGEKFASFGKKEENGYWPPHLHFQVIKDMEGLTGDYPGVCRYSESEAFLENCPDPLFILCNTFGTNSF
ncbi:peptidoglycan DD-metalloendopeptidase family protein [Pedobacter sp. PWIIR3]